ncbi:MAG: undecaprenyl/decaprenyl-phosphate alpha-N-acetylglucosaminyl 1-phosphate transferase [Myxococcales bacterium]|nr:undecaprenyl/decaprenyl-phosphate alpha-N-acetylglucosaminyl 1-phosphate transferase [Myxococcales bacterium]
MRALSLSLLLSAILALILTPLVRALALHLNALDPFSARKIVSPRPIPRMGGLAVALAFYATLAALWLAGSVLTRATLSPDTPVLGILIGSLPILLIGVLDDLRGLQALPKLSVEVSVSVGLWLAGLRIEPTHLLGLSAASDSVAAVWPPTLISVFSCLLTVAWLVGVMNATNLIDGLDGLASGVAFFALSTTAVAALLRGDLLLALLACALAGAVLGFLFYNLQPASIFLGDAGSLFLGYLLAATAIWSVRKAATAVLLVGPAVALGLPLLDTSLTISRRLLSGRPLMQGDGDHVHHRLRGLLGVRRAVWLLYGVCAVFSGLALAMLLGDKTTARVALALSLVVALVLGWALGYLRAGPRGLWQALRQRRQTRARLAAIQVAVQQAAQAVDVAALNRGLSSLSSELHGTPQVTCDPPSLHSPTSECYPIGAQQEVLGQLCITDRREPSTPDEQALLQLLADLLAPTLARVRKLSG